MCIRDRSIPIVSCLSKRNANFTFVPHPSVPDKSTGSVSYTHLVLRSIDWACISVLSQVIHNVTERKKVQTNMISFVSHGAGILTIMEASAEHLSLIHISPSATTVFRHADIFHDPVEIML